MQSAIAYLSQSSDWDLTPSAQLIQQRPLARGSGTRLCIIQELQKLRGCMVDGAGFDAQRSLARGWTHHFCGDLLPYQLSFTQPLHSGGGQDDGVVLSGFEFAQAAGSYSGPLRQFFDAVKFA